MHVSCNMSHVRKAMTVRSVDRQSQSGTNTILKSFSGTMTPRSTNGQDGSMLLEDDDLLRTIFLQLLEHHEAELSKKVDETFELSRKWTLSESHPDFEALEAYLRELAPDERLLVASAFSNMLNLHNITEEVYNSVHERAARLGQVRAGTATTHYAIQKLRKDGVSPEAIHEALSTQMVDLVFTAHPTQALRQSLLKKYAQIRKQLQYYHNSKMTSHEKTECLEAIRSVVEGAWRTDEIRRSKPTPQDEMRYGLSYIQETVFQCVPLFLRRIDSELVSMGQPRLAIDHQMFRFGSWMGGDRDGNPNVTPGITRDVVVVARLTAVNQYFKEVENMMFELSVWRASPELKEYAKELRARETADSLSIAEERKKRNYADFWTPVPSTEPFRVVLSSIRDRLYCTREVLQQCLLSQRDNVREALAESEDAYSKVDELLEPLKLMYDSLVATGDESLANSRLLDLIRQVSVFGLSLIKLDVRQESTRHSEVMDAITTELGLGQYSSWDEPRRLEFLFAELQGRRPLMPPDITFSPTAQDVVDTFRMLSKLPSDSVAAYVISMARSASDVLAVILLQRECRVKQLLRVVPLFETLTDLDGSTNAMRSLFSSEWYRSLINGHQECMIGYSDSGKDAGRLAAAWALYKVQENLVNLAEEYGISLTLFHGRGGTVGRGGGPTHMAILSQPPGTVRGSLRVTVQGEIIEQQFGEKEICFHTLDLYTSAVLEATLGKATQVEPKPEWRDVISRMALASCKKFQGMVHRNSTFVKYFRAATPVKELGRMNIGSRPASRRQDGGIETLRAIPWVFAWTQTRFHLPVWLGIGDAVREIIEAGQLQTLQEMYAQWPFFKVTIDMVEMVMAKADMHVFCMYERCLVADREMLEIGESLRASFEETKEMLLHVAGPTSVLASGSANPVLGAKLRLRAPYVTPLNILQVHCLKSLRELPQASGGASPPPEEASRYQPTDPRVLDLLSRDPGQELSKFHRAAEDTLQITIKGIAAGMQNTG